jgi:stage III sporulation protein AG
MDRIKRNKWPKNLRRYSYPAIVILIGVLLMLLPGQKKAEDNSEALIPPNETFEERLEKILSSAHGAGEVDILLSVAKGENTVYQTDLNSDTSEENKSVDSKTVLITDSQRIERGLVQQTNPPIYLGAVVCCQGADNPAVRLAIVEAVSTATGLGSDKITVLKMK